MFYNSRNPILCTHVSDFSDKKKLRKEHFATFINHFKLRLRKYYRSINRDNKFFSVYFCSSA